MYDDLFLNFQEAVFQVSLKIRVKGNEHGFNAVPGENIYGNFRPVKFLFDSSLKILCTYIV